MYTLEKLNLTNYIYIKEHLHRSITSKDFHLRHTAFNFIYFCIIKDNIRLILNNNEVLGYLWFNFQNESIITIESIYLENNIDLLELKKGLNNFFNPLEKIYFYTEDPNINIDFFNFLGFYLYKNILYMRILNLKQYSYDSTPPDLKVYIIPFILEKHDKIRCELQNSIFYHKDRVPLTLQDIHLEKYQNYFVHNSSFMMKFGEEFIGYGQVIKEKDDALNIVNICIKDEYRGRGYGKYLIEFLINKSKENNTNLDEIRLSVEKNNIPAISLYKKLGFKEYSSLKILKFSN